MVSYEREPLQPVFVIADAATGKRPAPQTIWRWVRKGCRGVRLEALLIGGVWHTSNEAFRAFIEGQTKVALTDTRPVPATDGQLTAAGLL